MSFSTLKDGLINKGKKQEHQHSVLSLVLKNCIIIQSNQFINGIPLFVIKVDETLSFEIYHCGIECRIPSLSSNRITTNDGGSITKVGKAKTNDQIFFIYDQGRQWRSEKF